VKVWLEETYNLRGVTPLIVVVKGSESWRRPII